MRIEDIRLEDAGTRRRAAARVVWEDRDQPAQELYFETTPAFANDFIASADAFMAAALPPAMACGERRIRVGGRLCTQLHDGAQAITALFANWYPQYPRPLIEASDGLAASLPRAARRTASFMSGGVDALALLRGNRLALPLDHPGAIRDCILVGGLNGYDFGPEGMRREREALFQKRIERLQAFAARADFTLIPLWTNTRTLYPSPQRWTEMGLASPLAACGHLLAPRITDAWIGSIGAGGDPPPNGSHPLLDHHYSNAAVDILHGQPAMTRLEKIEMIAGWDEALAVVEPCHQIEVRDDDAVNCGRCEKCVRTMLALLALGRLDAAPAFPLHDLTPQALDVVKIRRYFAAAFYAQCLPLLEARGRDDLARPLRRKIEDFHALEEWKRDRGWKGRLRRLDRRFLDGRLVRLSYALRSRLFGP
jgi:hypothetical protein